jgi:hypothetical protein
MEDWPPMYSQYEAHMAMEHFPLIHVFPSYKPPNVEDFPATFDDTVLLPPKLKIVDVFHKLVLQICRSMNLMVYGRGKYNTYI